jgi:DNA-directed RNA polymerase
MLDMPIIIGKSIKLDRKKIIKKLIKDKDNIKKIEKLKEKLNKDDINYIRKNIRLGPNSYNKKYIKIRIKIKSNILDTKALERGLCPSSIHSEDASILIKVIKECSDLNIGIIPIHDSVGSRIFFSSLIKCIYKKKFIEYIDYILSEKEFPINDIVLKKIDKKFECERINKLNKFLEIKKKIIEQIKKSNNLFN